MTVRWNEVDRHTAAVSRDDVACAAVDGEVVLYDPTVGRAHVLNATAGTVWSVLDGDADVATLGSEIAEAFGEDPDAVTDQVLSLVRDLGRLGLLTNVTGERSDSQEGCP